MDYYADTAFDSDDEGSAKSSAKINPRREHRDYVQVYSPQSTLKDFYRPFKYLRQLKLKIFAHDQLVERQIGRNYFFRLVGFTSDGEVVDERSEYRTVDDQLTPITLEVQTMGSMTKCALQLYDIVDQSQRPFLVC